jgi:hypothetical protein
MAHHDHDHEHDEDATFGIALGFRTVEEAGHLFLVEAEIAPYVDEPEELGVTLVFHPLEGLDPAAESEELDWPAWPVDIDEDLQRSGGTISAQFQAIVRQLHGLTNEQLLGYLGVARSDAEQGGNS